jgi:hypothetical protein
METPHPLLYATTGSEPRGWRRDPISGAAGGREGLTEATGLDGYIQGMLIDLARRARAACWGPARLDAQCAARGALAFTWASGGGSGRP